MDQGSLAPTHGLSQLAASFIAFQSLGIRRTPFPTFAAPIVLPHISGATGTCLQPSTRVDGITHFYFLSTRLFCSGSSINHAMPPFNRIDTAQAKSILSPTKRQAIATPSIFDILKPTNFKKANLLAKNRNQLKVYQPTTMLKHCQRVERK